MVLQGDIAYSSTINVNPFNNTNLEQVFYTSVSTFVNITEIESIHFMDRIQTVNQELTEVLAIIQGYNSTGYLNMVILNVTLCNTDAGKYCRFLGKIDEDVDEQNGHRKYISKFS